MGCANILVCGKKTKKWKVVDNKVTRVICQSKMSRHLTLDNLVCKTEISVAPNHKFIEELTSTVTLKEQIKDERALHPAIP